MVSVLRMEHNAYTLVLKHRTIRRQCSPDSDSGWAYLTDRFTHSFDPASLTILDRLNHVVTLLESRPLAVIAQPSDVSQPVSENSPSVNFLPSAAPAVEATTNLPEIDILHTLDIPGFPSAANNCEGVLRWPIFEGLVPDVHSFILESAKEDSGQAETIRTGSLGRGVQEDDFIPLSKKFLAYVHVKNPILEVADYKAQVRDAAENGPRWDGPSCLVVCPPNIVEALANDFQLISCALACLAAPFQTDPGINSTPESIRSSMSAYVDQDTASSYYLAAKKRLGLLQPSLLNTQCLFFCGVYEMYSLRPLEAWSHFNRACVDLRNLLWLRSQRRSPENHAVSRETHRLEQRLYWSCVKSE